MTGPAHRMIQSLALCALTLAVPAFAEEAPPAGAAPTTSTLRLGEPDIYKVGPGSFQLLSADLNGDGLADLVCADNRDSLIYLLYQRRERERRFEIVKESAEMVIGSLAVGDLNGDGRDDLALGGSQTYVRYQDADGKLGDPVELEEAGQVALAVDLNGDGRRDLLLCNDDETISLLQTAEGKFADPVRQRQVYPLQGRPLAFDANGDGRLDLVYQETTVGDRLILRARQEGGTFDPETAHQVGFHSWLDGASDLGGGGPGFVATEEKTHALKIMRWGPDPNRKPDDPIFSRLRMLPFTNEEGLTAANFRLSAVDLTGDGSAELAILTDVLPSLDLLRSDASGAFTRRSEPTLLGGVKLRLGKTSAASRTLWFLSHEEQALGAAKLEGADIPFPQLLELGSKPLAFDLADVNASGFDDLVFATTIEKKPLLLIRHDPAPDAIEKSLEARIDLEELDPAFKGIEIVDLLAADLNRDQRADIIVFSKYEGPRILLQGENETFRSILKSASVMGGLFEKLLPEQLVVADALGDGQNEILIAKGGFVRVLSMRGDGELTVLHQLNGKSGASKIASVAVGDVTGDGRPEIVLLDKGPQRLATIYRRNDAGEFEVLKHLEIDPLVGSSILAADLNKDGRADLAISARESFGVIFSGVEDPVLRRVAGLRTEVLEGGYRLVAAGNLTPDPGAEIAVLENKEHLLEFYRLTGEDTLTRIYKFKVFAGEGASGFFDPDQPAPPEPRELLFPDLNADNLPDLALIVHDKVIVYLQAPPSAN